MRHLASSSFWKEYQALPQEIRHRADKQFALLRVNPEDPSLHFKKLGESRGHEVGSRHPELQSLGNQTDGQLLVVLDRKSSTYDSLIS